MLSKDLMQTIRDVFNDDIAYSSYVGGGCIARSHKVVLQSGIHLFLKELGSPTEMFKKEASGLRELARYKGVEIPQVRFVSEDCLIMDFLKARTGTAEEFRNFGQALALLHLNKEKEFGFKEDNFIGMTSQKNTPSKSWATFFVGNRIREQIRLAKKKAPLSQHFSDIFDELIEKIYPFLDQDHIFPTPCHGDLWKENTMIIEGGKGALFDPAFYHGHSLVDLAMTKLFGSMPEEFYAGYAEILPSHETDLLLEKVYNLYHILNHYNLFGGGYLGQSESMAQDILNTISREFS